MSVNSTQLMQGLPGDRKSRRRVPRRHLLFGVSLAFSLALTGCGSSEDPGVASASGGAAKGAGETAPLTPDEMEAKHIQCMQENGIEPEDDEGPLTVEVSEEEMERLDKAFKACEKYEVSQDLLTVPPERMEKNLQIAKCMREKGFDFADPDPETGNFTSGYDLENPVWVAAAEVCFGRPVK